MGVVAKRVQPAGQERAGKIDGATRRIASLGETTQPGSVDFVALPRTNQHMGRPVPLASRHMHQAQPGAGKPTREFLMDKRLLMTSERKSAQQAVAETLRHAILAGELPPGTRLMQNDLAKLLEVSTTPIREAINELAGEGLVRLDPHRGASVSELSQDELYDLYKFRAMVEAYCIRLTVERITEEDLALAEDFVKRMDEVTDPVEYVYLNREFHSLLASATRSPHIAQVLTILRNVTLLYVSLSLRIGRQRLPKSNEDHRHLLETCRSRDTERAAQLIHDHLLGPLPVALEALEKLAQQREGSLLQDGPG